LSRIERFAAAVSEAGMAAALIMNPPDVYYLSGTGQPCNLLVTPGGEPVLFARRYLDLARRASHVERVLPGAGFSAVAREARLGDGPLGMELDKVPAALVDRARRAFPDREIADCSGLLLAQRAVKDAGEVEAMRASVRLFDAVHAAMCEHIRPGIAEYELAAEVERALRRAGHDGVVFQRRWDAKLPMEGGIASGENLSTISRGPITVTGVGMGEAFPMGASRRRLERGDLVNIDLGLNRAGYHGDMARTYAVGELPDGIEPLAHACREIQDVAMGVIRPGVSCESVYEAAKAAAERVGVADVFQGYDDLHGPYIGHSIGLELDEPPVLGPGVAEPLREGMVLAVEPKLISPAFGAVNIEDDVVVTADGCELLGDLPRCLFAVGESGDVARIP
jgi:Xaa-Pro dipeptidase